MNVVSEKSRQSDRLRSRPNGIASADIELDHRTSSMKPSGEMHPQAPVLFLITNLLNPHVFKDEDMSVVGFNITDRLEHVSYVGLVQGKNLGPASQCRAWASSA